MIPTYNRANILPVAIESVINQTQDNWELLVIDDGSTDNSREVVEPYLKNKKLTYYFQDNKGVSAARNKGIQMAIGEFIIFLDSDDYFDKEVLKNVNQALSNKPDLVCWEVTRFIEGRKKIQKPKELSGIYNHITAIFLAGSICYRRSLFNEVGRYDTALNFGENYELGQRISAKKDLKITIINKPLLYYVLNISTRKSNSIENRLSSYIYLYKKHRTEYDKNPKDSAEMNYLLGFVLEKTKRKKAAIERFKKSWFDNPRNPKPLLKILYLKFLS
ncbi:glycosyltransferase family 2 protein [Salinimicrobium xinjiangense]|uniref:glycosyltransferase family 2 protein n=1 Tax=Salinimicrobium xinjiangense TaxID=438596 RepID=UPI00040FB52E|nr:glycosyltransferase family A protein [Salinimicrobium xinjiangense]